MPILIALVTLFASAAFAAESSELALRWRLPRGESKITANQLIWIERAGTLLFGAERPIARQNLRVRMLRVAAGVGRVDDERIQDLVNVFTKVMLELAEARAGGKKEEAATYGEEALRAVAELHVLVGARTPAQMIDPRLSFWTITGAALAFHDAFPLGDHETTDEIEARLVAFIRGEATSFGALCEAMLTEKSRFYSKKKIARVEE